MAKTTLEQLLVRCATPLKDEEKTEELLAAQDKSFHMVTHDLVREVTSPNSTVRKQAMHSLQVLAQVTGKSVTVIMEPHKEVRPRTAVSLKLHVNAARYRNGCDILFNTKWAAVRECVGSL